MDETRRGEARRIARYIQDSHDDTRYLYSIGIWSRWIYSPNVPKLLDSCHPLDRMPDSAFQHVVLDSSQIPRVQSNTRIRYAWLNAYTLTLTTLRLNLAGWLALGVFHHTTQLLVTGNMECGMCSPKWETSCSRLYSFLTPSQDEKTRKRKPPPFFTGFVLFYFSYSTGLFEGNVHNCTFKTLVPHAATLDTSSRNFGISHREKTELR